MRAAAPIKASGGVFAFSHKTIQEFLVARSIRDVTISALKAALLPASELQSIVRSLCNTELTSAGKGSDGAFSFRAFMSRLEARFLEQFTTSELAKGRSEADVEEAARDARAEIRAKAKKFAQLVETLEASALQRVQLSREHTIVDFIVDELLEVCVRITPNNLLFHHRDLRMIPVYVISDTSSWREYYASGVGCY